MKAIETLATLSLITACTAVEAPPADQPEAPVEQAPKSPINGAPVAVYPASCGELLNQNAAAADGEYTLYVGNDSHKPWAAYCADMAATPAEYMELASVHGDHNFSQYTAGGASPGTNVRTSYTRLRIDPATLMVDIGDQRFTDSAGALTHSGSDPVSSMPFGVAMSCDGQTSGLANIDLRGTMFTLAGSFIEGGSTAGGGATMATDLQQADLTGGGFCGWTGPTNVPFNPFNAAHGWVLQLAYKS